MGRLSSFGQHLYTGRVSVDFVGRRRLWYTISVVILLASTLGFVVQGFNLGIEFKGGVELTAKVQQADTATADRLTRAIDEAGVPEAGDPIVTTSGQDTIRIDVRALTQDQTATLEKALTDAGATEVSQNLIGPSWGKQVASKALTGLLVFLVVVVVFIAAYFRDWRMSLAAVVALAHDVLITAGVYAWSGFEVTPATVTGFLTILGYSLYDTVVVYDKVRENTHGVLASNRRTYAEQANLAVNQTLVRSINTSVTALLPVLALLVVGVGVLGSGPLKDLALALFIGMAAGTYSSICIATPLAVQLRERDPAVKAHTKRVLARRAKDAQVAAEQAGADEAQPVAAGEQGSAVRGPGERRQPSRPPRSARKGGSGSGGR
ncbi:MULTISPECIES: protein translocase subunit SecF [unclassified Aeromicrobium]|jgi:preprotein translocase subunit SecF|uniref:protein translocase subunit SecF n=1 Tax=unclassified Aeromicrobium TaxID=2633570 RepID=UPI0020977CE3|nr:MULTISPECIES: protein translocase subunit SecF [unclassified Aeromicrobium]MCO7238513.1 protein translocase subunit SecF [Aeromicrobium sp. CnD17-E]MDR6119326.1 preprotein translocase subunit SecF [Aeromicrobium sp. SORGH_AS_0981]